MILFQRRMRPVVVGLIVVAFVTSIASCGTDVKPKARGRDRGVGDDQPVRATLSVLVTQARIYVGVTGVPGGPRTNTIERDSATPPDQVWAKLEADLVKLKGEYFANRTDLELAAETAHSRAVPYQDVVTAMDHAVKAGFIDIGVTDPTGLSWRPPSSD